MAEISTVRAEKPGKLPLGCDWRASHNVGRAGHYGNTRNPKDWQFDIRTEKFRVKFERDGDQLPEQTVRLVDGIRGFLKGDWEFAAFLGWDLSASRSRGEGQAGMREFQIVLVDKSKNGMTSVPPLADDLFVEAMQSQVEREEHIPFFRIAKDPCNRLLGGTGFFSKDGFTVEQGLVYPMVKEGIPLLKYRVKGFIPEYQEGVLIIKGEVVDASKIIEENKQLEKDRERNLASLLEQLRISTAEAQPYVVENPTPLF